MSLGSTPGGGITLGPVLRWQGNQRDAQCVKSGARLAEPTAPCIILEAFRWVLSLGSRRGCDEGKGGRR